MRSLLFLPAPVPGFSQSCENRPGTLAHVAKVLADAKVNVLALLCSTAGAQGSAQVVVDNVNQAKKALGAAGLSYTEGTLDQVELANKPGALAELTERLAKKGINIECADATMPTGAKKAVVVLGHIQGGRGERGLSAGLTPQPRRKHVYACVGHFPALEQCLEVVAGVGYTVKPVCLPAEPECNGYSFHPSPTDFLPQRVKKLLAYARLVASSCEYNSMKFNVLGLPQAWKKICKFSFGGFVCWHATGFALIPAMVPP